MKCPTNIPLSCALHFISTLVMLRKNPISVFVKWWTMIIHQCSQPCYLWSFLTAWSSSITLRKATWSSTQINTWLDLSWIIWSTLSHHVTLIIGSLITTASSSLIALCPLASSPCSSFTALTVHHTRASNLPFKVQTSNPVIRSQAIPLDLLRLSCLICNELFHQH